VDRRRRHRVRSLVRLRRHRRRGVGLGGLALGLASLGGAAVGWFAAIGGLAIARDYAVGGVAVARQAVDGFAPGSRPAMPIPHPPFRAADAVVLVALVLALLGLARAIDRARRR
jgi:hypothetical protein